MAEKTMKVSAEELAENRIDLGFRDYCAHLLIPLNQCRRRSMYLPFKCEDERHAYEKCQYEDYISRMKIAVEHAGEHK